MPHEYPNRGERAEKNSSMRNDIEKAADKPEWCPTCGQKMGTGTTAVGSSGSSAGGGG